MWKWHVVWKCGGMLTIHNSFNFELQLWPVQEWRSCSFLCVGLLLWFMFTELESQLKQQQPPDLKREIITLDGESSPKVRELEKIVRLLKQEKEEAQKASTWKKNPTLCFCVDGQKWCDIQEIVKSGKHYSYVHFAKTTVVSWVATVEQWVGSSGRVRKNPQQKYWTRHLLVKVTGVEFATRCPSWTRFHQRVPHGRLHLPHERLASVPPCRWLMRKVSEKRKMQKCIIRVLLLCFVSIWHVNFLLRKLCNIWGFPSGEDSHCGLNHCNYNKHHWECTMQQIFLLQSLLLLLLPPPPPYCLLPLLFPSSSCSLFLC